MDNLLAGKLILLFQGGGLLAIVMSSATPLSPKNHSGHGESHSGLGTKTVRLRAGITVRVQPGILFVFTPEGFSRSSRNSCSPWTRIRTRTTGLAGPATSQKVSP